MILNNYNNHCWMVSEILNSPKLYRYPLFLLSTLTHFSVSVLISAAPITTPVAAALAAYEDTDQPRSYYEPQPINTVHTAPLTTPVTFDKSSAIPAAAEKIEPAHHHTILDRSFTPSLHCESDAPADKDQWRPSVKAQAQGLSDGAPAPAEAAKPKRRKSQEDSLAQLDNSVTPAQQEDCGISSPAVTSVILLQPETDKGVLVVPENNQLIGLNSSLVSVAYEPQQRTTESTVIVERGGERTAEAEHDTSQFTEGSGSYIADGPADLVPIPEDEPLTNLTPLLPTAGDTAVDDTVLQRSGSKKKKSKSRRGSVVSLAEELEQVGEELPDTTTSSVDNTRPSSPTPSEASFALGDDASGGEQQSKTKSKKKKKSGSQRRKERALKRKSLTDLTQVHQGTPTTEGPSQISPLGAEGTATVVVNTSSVEQNLGSIELSSEDIKLEQSENTGGVKLGVSTFFEGEQKQDEARAEEETRS